MKRRDSAGSRWLSLSRAAQRLGVHPTTLRRWAENGDFPVMVTPGGHRRFAESDLERFAAQGGKNAGPAELPDRWIDETLNVFEQALSEVRPPVLARFSREDGSRIRDIARQLLESIRSSLSQSMPPLELVQHGRAAGHEVGGLVLDRIGSLSDAIEIAILLRAASARVASSSSSVSSVGPELRTRIEERLGALLDGYQLSLCELFQDRVHAGANNRS
jgi:excisionase family DNA binding protein